MASKPLIRRLTLMGMFIIPAGLFLFGCAESKPIILERTFVDGRTFYVERSEVTTQKISGIPAFAKEEKETQLFGALFTTAANPDGSNTVTITFDRAKYLVEDDEGIQEFDTDNPDFEEAAPQLGAILNPMIGESITVKYDKDNQVASFTGMNELVAKIDKSVGWSMRWDDMKRKFNDTQGKIQWAENPIAPLSSREAVIGDTWEKSYSFAVEHMGAMVIDKTFTVTGINKTGDHPLVEITTAMHLYNKTETESAGSGDENKGPKIEGNFKGTCIFDSELGLITRAESTGHTDVSLTPFPGANMKISIDRTYTTVVHGQGKTRGSKSWPLITGNNHYGSI